MSLECFHHTAEKVNCERFNEVHMLFCTNLLTLLSKADIDLCFSSVIIRLKLLKVLNDTGRGHEQRSHSADCTVQKPKVT